VKKILNVFPRHPRISKRARLGCTPLPDNEVGLSVYSSCRTHVIRPGARPRLALHYYYFSPPVKEYLSLMNASIFILKT
jgi:hypothetical protein